MRHHGALARSVAVPALRYAPAVPEHPSAPPCRTIEAIIAALDPDVLAAKADVDITLIHAALARKPAERLVAAHRVLRDLVHIRDRHAASARR